MEANVKAFYTKSKFDTIVENIFEKISGGDDKYKNKIFYHYTSPEVLTNILKKDNMVLRFTKSDCLNDKSEGKEFYFIYKEVCEEIFKNEQISDDFYKLIKNIEFKDVFCAYINNGYNIVKKDCDTYICCFSESKDILSMWNYYCKNDKYEGYNIGIQFENYSDVGKCFFNDEKDYAEVDFYRVIYNKDVVKNILSEFLIDLYENTDYRLYYEKEAIVDTILLVTTKLKYIIKNEAFSHEKEIRFIINVIKNKNSYNINFTSKKGLITPYIDLKLEKKFLKEITIGSLIEKEIAKNNLEFLLRYNEYILDVEENRIKIDFSEIPIRY